MFAEKILQETPIFYGSFDAKTSSISVIGPLSVLWSHQGHHFLEFLPVYFTVDKHLLKYSDAQNLKQKSKFLYRQIWLV